MGSQLLLLLLLTMAGGLPWATANQTASVDTPPSPPNATFDEDPCSPATLWSWRCDPAVCSAAPSVASFALYQRLGNYVTALQRFLVVSAQEGCAVKLDHPLRPLQHTCACLVPSTYNGSHCPVGAGRDFWHYFYLRVSPAALRSTVAAVRLHFGFNATHVAGVACPDGPNATDHLAIKVRSGDVMKGGWHHGHWEPSKHIYPAYGQPHLGFYFTLLGLQRWTGVHVICEDTNNPVCPVLQQAALAKHLNLRVSVGLLLHDVVVAMACARHVANAYGTMGSVWGFSPRLTHRFEFTSPAPNSSHCPDGLQHELVLVGTDNYFRPRVVPGPASPHDWHNTGEERSRMLAPHPVTIVTCPACRAPASITGD